MWRQLLRFVPRGRHTSRGLAVWAQVVPAPCSSRQLLPCRALSLHADDSTHSCYASGNNNDTTADGNNLTPADWEQQVLRLQRELTGERRRRVQADALLREAAEAAADTNGWVLSPIGHVESPLRHRFGTPRQGLLAPALKGRVVLDSLVVSRESLRGLQDFSHVWVVFGFHKNTNLHRQRQLRARQEAHRTAARAAAEAGLPVPPLRDRAVFPSVVTPPRGVRGETVGVFACRSPHRPNPIGLSLMAVDGVDERTCSLRVSGLDLLDGTPVLDIKPYLPTDVIPTGTTVWAGARSADAVVSAAAEGAGDDTVAPLRFPEWVRRDVQEAEDFEVEFSPAAEAALQALFATSQRRGRRSARDHGRELGDAAAATTVLRQLLALDPARGVVPSAATSAGGSGRRGDRHGQTEQAATATVPPPTAVAGRGGKGPFFLQVGGVQARFWRIGGSGSDGDAAADGGALRGVAFVDSISAGDK